MTLRSNVLIRPVTDDLADMHLCPLDLHPHGAVACGRAECRRRDVRRMVKAHGMTESIMEEVASALVTGTLAR